MIAAYEAPFADGASKAGARAFPLMIPRTPEAPGAAAGQRVLDALARRRAARSSCCGPTATRSSR